MDKTIRRRHRRRRRAAWNHPAPEPVRSCPASHLILADDLKYLPERRCREVCPIIAEQDRQLRDEP